MPIFVQLLCNSLLMKRSFLLFFFFTMSLQAQYQVNGIIKDSETKKPLPFATITTESGIATISDVDGKFSISFVNQPETLMISYA